MSKRRKHIPQRVDDEYIYALIINKAKVGHSKLKIKLLAFKVINCFWDIDFDVTDALLTNDIKELHHSQLLRATLRKEFPDYWKDFISQKFGLVPANQDTL